MTDTDTTCLQDCLDRYRDSIPGLSAVAAPSASDSPASLIERYEQCYPLLEQALWSGESDFAALLDCYQALFREQDALIRQQAQAGATPDARHHFILSIPVADRPAHLRACLDSIYRLCECFGYGGSEAGVYRRIRVIVAEDSREQRNIRQHIALCEEYRNRGLQVTHFGLDEQYELLQAIPEHDRSKLGNLLTKQPRDRFYLKGQAANRNLSVLKCLQLTEHPERTLYYFVDSDELFCVNRPTAGGEQAVYALNYFHYIDRAFRSTGTRVLTGKMVGDPPVSPAVMAVNFLDDVTAFFTRLAELRGDRDCSFHELSRTAADGAVYHDMAGLFGFAQQAASFPYRCPLEGKHDHAACLRRFAQRLAAFFFGEHLTRKTCFAYGNGFAALTPARTVYPGNTVVNHAGLKYIIPFGHLRLRMSGPTAGRLIAAEIHDRFASINLPHLHRRTTDTGLDDSFRPGVEITTDDRQSHPDSDARHPGASSCHTDSDARHPGASSGHTDSDARHPDSSSAHPDSDARHPDLHSRHPGESRDPANAPRAAIDLSNEFERQFFGDLMLFTSEALVTEADVRMPFEKEIVARIMTQKEQELLALYQQKHDAIEERSRKLDALVFDAGHWWLDDPDLAGALHQVRAFIDNIDHNFGAQSPAWRQIQSTDHRKQRKHQLTEALLDYRAERNAWDHLIG